MGFRPPTASGPSTVNFGPPTAAIDIGDTQTEGVSTRVARSDHQHAVPAPASAPPALAAASGIGTATTPARSDHTHAHTAADHLDGGHADLTDHFDAAGAAVSAVALHEADDDDPHAAAGYLTDPEVADLIAAALVDYLPLTGGTVTGAVTLDGGATMGDDLDLAGHALTGAQIGPYSEAVVTRGAVSGATDLDLDLANVYADTLDDDTTYSFANVPATGAVSLTLVLTVPDTDPAYVVTWPGSVIWPGGEAPDLAADSTYLLTFLSVDGGVTWLGAGGGAGHA